MPADAWPTSALHLPCQTLVPKTLQPYLIPPNPRQMADVDASDMRIVFAFLPVTNLLFPCHPRQMAGVDASDMRVDLAAGGHIAWANDLETRRMYWTWPSN